MAAGNTVTVHAKATKGVVQVYSGTQSNVRGKYERKKTLNATTTDDFKFEIRVASTIYIGVKLRHADAACKVKYTTKSTIGKETTAPVDTALVTKTGD